MREGGEDYPAAAALLLAGLHAVGAGGLEQNPAEGVRLLTESCESGEALIACVNLGQLHLLGQFVDQDLDHGAGLIDSACEDGLATACKQLATLYRGFASPLEEDQEAVAHYLGRTCELGSADECLSVGMMHHSGMNIPADPQRAIAYFQSACDLGNEQGCHMLGEMRALEHSDQPN